MGWKGMTQTAQVRLTASRGSESRHLWLYAGHLGPVVGEPIAGDLIDVLTSDGRFYGRGLYNPASKIRVRLLTFQNEPIDERSGWGEFNRRSTYGNASSLSPMRTV